MYEKPTITTYLSCLTLFSGWLKPEPIGPAVKDFDENGCPIIRVVAICQPFPPPPECDPNADSCGKGSKCCPGLCGSISCKKGNMYLTAFDKSGLPAKLNSTH